MQFYFLIILTLDNSLPWWLHHCNWPLQADWHTNCCQSCDVLGPCIFDPEWWQALPSYLQQMPQSTMNLKFQLQHHKSLVTTISINPAGDRILSAGMQQYSTSCTLRLTWRSADAWVVIWNFTTGKKMQVISCAFNRAIGSSVWFPYTPTMTHSFCIWLLIWQCSCCNREEWVRECPGRGVPGVLTRVLGTCWSITFVD